MKDNGMTLTSEQSSNKEWLESISDTDLEEVIRRAMSQGCIHPSYVFDAVDEALDRLAKIEAIVKSIDLTKCAPLPWKSKLKSCKIVSTGEYDGWDVAEDARGQEVVFKSDDDPFYRNVELDDGDHDADILAICDSINAVRTIKEILIEKEKSRPRRNCDIYYSADEAHAAHEKFRSEWIEGKFGFTGREPPWFGEWIMAPINKKWGSKA